jgi:acyl-CoA reductase-like NAD-dependent aldehyde dehydrogenase
VTGEPRWPTAIAWRSPGSRSTCGVAVVRPEPGARTGFQLVRARGASFGLSHSPFVVGGAATDDLVVRRWPAGAVRLHLVDGELYVEAAVDGVTVDGVAQGLGAPLTSHNPAADGAVVFTTAVDDSAVARACDAAAAAAPAWARLTLAERAAHWRGGKTRSPPARPSWSRPSSGKPGRSRARRSRRSRPCSRASTSPATWRPADLREGAIAGSAHEQLRYHPLGVVAVIGPYNYPNPTCATPTSCRRSSPATPSSSSRRTSPPLAGQRYAETAAAAGLPPGVFNLVLGTGAVGAAAGSPTDGSRACASPAATRSAAASRRPPSIGPSSWSPSRWGGKNTAIVFDDASVRQAAHEILVGGYLSAGQRCTATSRVLVQAKVAAPLLDALRRAAPTLRFGHPRRRPPASPGPIATRRIDAFLQARSYDDQRADICSTSGRSTCSAPRPRPGPRPTMIWRGSAGTTTSSTAIA